MSAIRLALACLSLALIAACAPGGAARSDFNPHTGIASHVSAPVTLQFDADARLQVNAVVLQAGPQWGSEQSRYALLTSVVRDGPNFPIIESVWSLGRELDYEKFDRRRIRCSSGCLREETGAIHLTAAAFRHAAQVGLSFQMVGRRGTYTGTAPAEIFAAALDQAAHGIP